MTTDVDKAVKLWNPPDINKKDNLSEWEKDLKEKSGEFLVWPSGYFGTYERAYALMGWNELMLNIAGNPKVVEELLDKVCDYYTDLPANKSKVKGQADESYYYCMIG